MPKSNKLKKIETATQTTTETTKQFNKGNIMFNFDELVEITTSNSRKTDSQKYDLTYSVKTKRFNLSASAIALMGLEEKGLTVFNHPKENVVLLAVRDEEHSKFFKKKAGASKKGSSFKNETLRALLDGYGITTVGMSLEKVGEHSGTAYYVIKAVEQSGQLADLTEDDTDQIVLHNKFEDDVQNEDEVENNVNEEFETKS